MTEEKLVRTWARYADGTYRPSEVYGETYAHQIVAEANEILERRGCLWRFEIFPLGVTPDQTKGA